MSELNIKENCLGFELYDGDNLVTLYRAKEHIERSEAPKPCFHPIYTPSGHLITEYRPSDHAWHTGLYYGWVHANHANLWGGPWYLKEVGKYQLYPGTHGEQKHQGFEISASDGVVTVQQSVDFLDGKDALMARDNRSFEFRKLEGDTGTIWNITTEISPEVDALALGASRAAKYSGLELRMGPPFAPADHRNSEGLAGHENIMHQRGRWCVAAGECGGAVAMFDHPDNPRHPTDWFTRKNLMGAGLLVSGDLEVRKGEPLRLRYAFLVLDENPSDEFIEAQYETWSTA
ncbi:MAG: PmoA family protein [Planctomycetota bacterium]|jgi:hypothetical protein|nr:PmoA family protein [Planctomycetota bacterium]MDP7251385.1 PmoA family protein [Planctomycetota bacterium]